MSETPAAPPAPGSSEEKVGARRRNLLYATALLICSYVTFGALGILHGILIVGAWAYVFNSRSSGGASFLVCAAVMSWGLFAGFVIPAVSTPWEGSWRSGCRKNLMQISLALHNYHADFNSFPAAYLADEDGRPMHSWRVLILPYLDEESLYDAYDFSEPWDGPNNRELLSKMPSVYDCRSTRERRSPGCTSYGAVTGPSTPIGRKLSDMTDGDSNTVVLVECDSEQIPWMEPRDLNFDDALDLLASTEPESAGGHRWEDFFHTHYDGRHVALVDGNVRFIPNGVDRDFWAELLTIDDGGPPDDWTTTGDTVSRLKIGNCCRLAIFVLLTLLPLPWVWLKPRPASQEIQP